MLTFEGGSGMPSGGGGGGGIGGDEITIMVVGMLGDNRSDSDERMLSSRPPDVRRCKYVRLPQNMESTNSRF